MPAGKSLAFKKHDGLGFIAKSGARYIPSSTDHFKTLITRCESTFKVYNEQACSYKKPENFWRLLHEAENINKLIISDLVYWGSASLEDQFLLVTGRKYLVLKGYGEPMSEGNAEQLRRLNRRNDILRGQYRAAMTLYLIWMSEESETINLLPRELIDFIAGYVNQWSIFFHNYWREQIRLYHMHW